MSRGKQLNGKFLILMEKIFYFDAKISLRAENFPSIFQLKFFSIKLFSPCQKDYRINDKVLSRNQTMEEGIIN